jgi:hypothetical protein
MKRKQRRTHRTRGKKRQSIRTPRAGKGQRRKHQQGRPSRRQKLSSQVRARRQTGRPQSAKQFFARSKQGRDEWEKVTSVVSEARATRKSPRKIAKRLGIEFKTVLRKTGRVIRKRNGRYVVQPTDKLLRVLVIPTKKGLREIATRDSRQASLIAEYWIAVNRYRDSGDATTLRKFQGNRVVDANGKRVRLLTDLRELDRQANAGVLSFESIYAQR